MSEYIEVGQPLQFTDPNTPTRVGEIVENVSDIYNIPSPHLGMQVFVKSEKKSFVITSLKSKVVNGVDVPEAAVEAFEAVGAKSITWNNDTDPSNMNDFVVAGVYDIKGEHTRMDDNLPILNTGGGHTFNARLTVLDSSISGSGNSDDKCITQVLSFSNRLGQGEVYIRTGKGSSLYNLTWENWSTLQRNVNVGEVGSLDDLKDNGIYSGVWKQGRINPNYLAFVCIVINDYFIGIAPRRVSQFVYGLSKSDGSVVYQSRVWDDSKGMWGNWEILNQKEIASMISAEIKKVTDGVDPNKIDSLKDIITWIEEHGDVAGILAAIEGLYDELGREIDARMSVDNDTRGKGVLFGGFSNRQTTADEVVIGYKNIAQNAEGAFSIPAATTEKAGVMSAEDKRIIKDIRPQHDDAFYITDVQGNIISKLDKDGLDTLISNPLKERIISFLPIQEKYDDKFFVCDKKGNVVLRIDSNGLDGIISRGVLMKASKESSWLSGKTFVALGASLSTGGHWQKSLAENTGGIFLEDVHKNTPCAYGGSATYGGVMSQQDRAMRLRKYLDDNNVKLDVLLIENANDMNKIGQSVDVNTDLPWLWTSTHDYTGYIATSYSDAINNFKNNIAEVLDGIEPLHGVKIKLAYSGQTSANVKVSSPATTDGIITLKVGANEYGVSVLAGATVSSIVNKILEWSYEGYNDLLGTDKSSVDFSAINGSADVIIVNNTTGASVSVSTKQAINYVNYTYKELTTDNWLNPNSWGESWSVETLSRCYKGLIEYLDKYFPDTLVVWVGLPHYLYDFTNGTKREDGSYDIEDFVASKRYVDEENLYILQKQVCKIYRIPFIDLRENCNISLIKAKNYYNDKDVHPVVSKGAYQLWGEALARLLS